MTKSQPLSAKDYLWILGVTLAVLALVPLIAAFGAVMQVGFVLILPTVLLATTVRAFTSHSEPTLPRTPRASTPTHLGMNGHGWA
jgi:phage tail protein X